MANKPQCKLRAVPLEDVTITDAFWNPRLETNRTVTLRSVYKQCKRTGRIDALKLTWKPGQPNEPHNFWDSDVAKWIEAAAYSLAIHPDRTLQRLVDNVINLIAAAQQDDGYINVHYTTVEPQNRWMNLRCGHELYCAGHLIEAAVAYYEATGKRKLLEVMCRCANHIDSVFGRAKGKKRGYPGHPEIELALVKLYQATGRKRYLKLSRYFIDERGRRPHYYEIEAKARGEDSSVSLRDEPYEDTQAHLPPRRQGEAVGHAVRAMYLCAGMADVAGLAGDVELLAACKRIWKDVTERKVYLTGGIGSAREHEAFTRAYDLPNDVAYAETCAAIALVFFAHRMLQIEADAKYADVMERALYSGVLSGVSRDGERFFYANPLQVDPAAYKDSPDHLQPTRRPWFSCACCPTNVARLLASLGQYIYSASDTAAYVHLYVAGSGAARIAERNVTLTQRTNYPWAGSVKITVAVAGPATFALMLRIPGWCGRHKITVNGRPAGAAVTKGYARIRRCWHDGDTVKLSLAMPVERIVAHPSVAADAGRVAIQRGPIVYCLEQCDHSADVLSIALTKKARLAARFDANTLGGIVTIEGTGVVPSAAGGLYRRAEELKTRKVKIKAVPYCLWGNRKPGAMTVFLPSV